MGSEPMCHGAETRMGVCCVCAKATRRPGAVSLSWQGLDRRPSKYNDFISQQHCAVLSTRKSPPKDTSLRVTEQCATHVVKGRQLQ